MDDSLFKEQAQIQQTRLKTAARPIQKHIRTMVSYASKDRVKDKEA